MSGHGRCHYIVRGGRDPPAPRAESIARCNLLASSCSTSFYLFRSLCLSLAASHALYLCPSFRPALPLTLIAKFTWHQSAFSIKGNIKLLLYTRSHTSSNTHISTHTYAEYIWVCRIIVACLQFLHLFCFFYRCCCPALSFSQDSVHLVTSKLWKLSQVIRLAATPTLPLRSKHRQGCAKRTLSVVYTTGTTANATMKYPGNMT